MSAEERDPLISTVVLMVLSIGVVAGLAFYLALRTQLRHGWAAGGDPPRWVHLVYAAVWVLSLIAAIRALFGDGGLKVAALAIVPIVLLAPPASSLSVPFSGVHARTTATRRRLRGRSSVGFHARWSDLIKRPSLATRPNSGSRRVPTRVGPLWFPKRISRSAQPGPRTSNLCHARG